MKKWSWLIWVGVIGFCGFGTFGVQRYSQMQKAASAPKIDDIYTVGKGQILVQVVESGGIEAYRIADVKSRAAGRLKRLLVEEGDIVTKGQLIAEIDPQETRLKVDQTSAQLRGAESAVDRQRIEIEQQRVLVQTNVEKARERLKLLQLELVAQPKLTNATIDSAQSALAGAKSSRDQLSKVTQPNERAQLEADVRDADAAYANAQNELRRLEDLYKQDFVSQREVQNQTVQVESARNRRSTARERLSRLVQQQSAELRQAEERVRQAENDFARAKANAYQNDSKLNEVRQARIAVREAEVQVKEIDALLAGLRQNQASADQIRSSLSDSQRELGETNIRAPYDGVITKKLVQEGELVSSLSSFSNGTSIVKLEDRSKMLVKMNINEIDVAKLKIGMSAKVVVDSFPNQTLNATITKIAPAKVEAAATTETVVRYQVEVTIKNAPSILKSGLTARTTMDVIRKENTLTIPIDYLVREGTKTFVLIPPTDPKDKAEPTKKEVTIGAESGSNVEILSGISVGAKIKRPKFSGPDRQGARIGRGGD